MISLGNWTRASFCTGIVLTGLISSLLVQGASAGGSPPNVIMFVLDDLNDWVGPLGHKEVKTPNMDRLAKSGVTFMNAHAPGVFCAPSRTAIWTGLNASTTGCYKEDVFRFDYPNIVTMQTAFKQGGYDTFGAGKLYHHRGGYVDLRDWDEYFSYSQAMRDQGWEMDCYHQSGVPLPDPHPYSPYYTKTGRKIKPAGHMEWGPIANELEEEMCDTQRANFGCEVIRRKHKKPFFLAVGMYTPHDPHYAPQKYFDLYDEDKITLPPFKKDDLDDLPPKIRKKFMNRSKQYEELVALGGQKGSIHGYYAAISYADAMLGRLLDALESSPYKDNTIVLLWSDQGYHLGEKGNWGKHTLWKRTTHVPFIWAGKDVAKNQKVDKAVTLIDIYPTLAEICGLPHPKNLEGISLASTLKKPSSAKARDVFIPYMEREGYAVVNEDWRYIQYGDGTEELYNAKDDPHEWNNLADNPEYRPIKKAMAKAAPAKFAPPVTPKKELTLKIEGDTFHWEKKKKK